MPLLSDFIFCLSIEACMKVHAKASEADVEEQIRAILKHAPNKPGGSRFKVSVTSFQHSIFY